MDFMSKQVRKGNKISKSIWSCDTPPTEKVKVGTKLVLPYVWNFKAPVGKTPIKDIEAVMLEDGTLADALFILEDAAVKFVQAHGARDIRQYYIENVKKEYGFLVFWYGT